ncbi:hypothetical protein B0G38_002491 [Arthrobacter sp. VKM Ac-2550]|nr:hypothetical protein [Arthrobacter sp. VKM Ac-2550]
MTCTKPYFCIPLKSSWPREPDGIGLLDAADMAGYAGANIL